VHEAKVAADLKSMRNNVAFAFFMMNAFWIIIIFMMQSVKDKVRVACGKSLLLLIYKMRIG
jgi:chitin synthase